MPPPFLSCIIRRTLRRTQSARPSFFCAAAGNRAKVRKRALCRAAAPSPPGCARAHAAHASDRMQHVRCCIASRMGRIAPARKQKTGRLRTLSLVTPSSGRPMCCSSAGSAQAAVKAKRAQRAMRPPDMHLYDRARTRLYQGDRVHAVAAADTDLWRATGEPHGKHRAAKARGSWPRRVQRGRDRAPPAADTAAGGFWSFRGDGRAESAMAAS